HCAFITVSSRENADLIIKEFHNKRFLEGMANPMQVREANQPKPKSSYSTYQCPAILVPSGAIVSQGGGYIKLAPPSISQYYPQTQFLPGNYVQNLQQQTSYANGNCYSFSGYSP